MPEPLTITLKTLTPLWTGGADGKSDRLHVTGMMGSLRWWYEAVVRGWDGYACDPTHQSCIYDADKPYNDLCLGCQLFGATGWARRFRLSLDDATRPAGTTGPQQPNGNRFKRNNPNQPPSWYFPSQGRGGTFALSIVPTSEDFDPLIILGLLKLVEQRAGLAAKTQLGYGWIKLQESPPIDANAFAQKMRAVAARQSGKSNGLPNLHEMFFARVRPGDTGLTATLNLKYDVRAAFRNAFGGNQQLRHWVCGSVRGNDRQASKVYFSQAVDSSMRIWGWIPDAPSDFHVTRNQAVDEIRAAVSNYATLQSWREFNSPRDTIKRESDSVAFLVSLLQEDK